MNFARIFKHEDLVKHDFEVLLLDRPLAYRTEEISQELDLGSKARQVVLRGELNKRPGISSDSGALKVILLDNALLIIESMARDGVYRLHKPIIPLPLLANPPVVESGRQHGYPISFVRLGRSGYQLTLWASTPGLFKTWQDALAKQREGLRERTKIFKYSTLSEGFFTESNQVNCATLFSHDHNIAYGTNEGIYFADLRNPAHKPQKVLALPDIGHIAIDTDRNMLAVLTGSNVVAFPLDTLDPHDPVTGLPHARLVSRDVALFAFGICNDRRLMCSAKLKRDENQGIKMTEVLRSKAGRIEMSTFAEILLPEPVSSILFLRTKLCVEYPKGYTILDPDTQGTQTLLDPTDSGLSFMEGREGLRSLAMFKSTARILLCTSEFALWIDSSGKLVAPSESILYWKGIPTAIAMRHPYVVAFSSSFIEIWHIDTRELIQVIQGDGIRCLDATSPCANTMESFPASAQSRDIIALLDGKVVALRLNKA